MLMLVLELLLLVGAFWIGVGGVCLVDHVVVVDDVDVECVGIRIWSDRFCVCVDVEFFGRLLRLCRRSGSLSLWGQSRTVLLLLLLVVVG